jgi:hypothetical protein
VDQKQEPVPVPPLRCAACSSSDVAITRQRVFDEFSQMGTPEIERTVVAVIVTTTCNLCGHVDVKRIAVKPPD